jgi:hypothetical protein
MHTRIKVSHITGEPVPDYGERLTDCGSVVCFRFAEHGRTESGTTLYECDLWSSNAWDTFEDLTNWDETFWVTFTYTDDMGRLVTLEMGELNDA